MKRAPQIKASGLEGNYLTLMEFNNVVLAGRHKHGMVSVTCEWVQNHTSLWQGHSWIRPCFQSAVVLPLSARPCRTMSVPIYWPHCNTFHSFSASTPSWLIRLEHTSSSDASSQGLYTVAGLADIATKMSG